MLVVIVEFCGSFVFFRMRVFIEILDGEKMRFFVERVGMLSSYRLIGFFTRFSFFRGIVNPYGSFWEWENLKEGTVQGVQNRVFFCNVGCCLLLCWLTFFMQEKMYPVFLDLCCLVVQSFCFWFFWTCHCCLVTCIGFSYCNLHLDPWVLFVSLNSCLNDILIFQLC